MFPRVHLINFDRRESAYPADNAIGEVVNYALRTEHRTQAGQYDQLSDSAAALPGSKSPNGQQSKAYVPVHRELF